VRTKPLRTFKADGAIAERGAFRAAGDDADVEGHAVLSSQFSVLTFQFSVDAMRISDFRLAILF
jgi:hypothetical protein